MKWRIRIFFWRLIDYFIHLPLRCLRLFKWIFWLHPLQGRHVLQRWLAGIILLLIDITPVPFLLESLMELIKAQSRLLTYNEIGLAKSIFGKSIPYNIIGMDPASRPAQKNKPVAYVTFHTINFNSAIPVEIFIHELVHVWQYRNSGAVYISESIWAQHWGGGYNYGGIEKLIQNVDIGLKAFNFEQQAEIIEDYFRLKNRLPLQWVAWTPDLEDLLKRYVAEVEGISSFT